MERERDRYNKGKPLSFKERMEYVWDYYKWIIIFGVVIVAFLIVAIPQLFRSNSADFHMMYIGEGVITAAGLEDLQDAVGDIAEDRNGDGKVRLDLIELTVKTVLSSNETYDYEYQSEVLRRFETEIRVGDSALFIVDISYYEKLTELGLLAKLADVLGENADLSAARDEYSFVLKDLEIAELTGFSYFPRESIVCIRRSPSEDTVKNGRSEEQYEHEKHLFERMVNYKAPIDYIRHSFGILQISDRRLTSVGVNALDDAVYRLARELDANYIGGVDYKNITAKYLPLDDSGIKQPAEDSKAEAVETVKNGKYSIIIAEREYYDILAAEGLLVNMADIVKAEGAYAELECGVYLRDIELCNIKGFYSMENISAEKSLVVCLLKEEYSTDSNAYIKDKAFFKSIITRTES